MITLSGFHCTLLQSTEYLISFISERMLLEPGSVRKENFPDIGLEVCKLFGRPIDALVLDPHCWRGWGRGRCK
jgi:hypothetical protein